jgi:hypothetical protein
MDGMMIKKLKEELLRLAALVREAKDAATKESFKK